jgi:hypothetical protein
LWLSSGGEIERRTATNATIEATTRSVAEWTASKRTPTNP